MNPENGREIVFPFEDYSTQRQAVSNQLASLILNQAEDILGKNLSYYWYRENYKELQYLEQIRPLDQNTQALARQVYEKGVGYGYGRLINQMTKCFPKRLLRPYCVWVLPKTSVLGFAITPSHRRNANTILKSK